MEIITILWIGGLITTGAAVFAVAATAFSGTSSHSSGDDYDDSQQFNNPRECPIYRGSHRFATEHVIRLLLW